jgi:hypothetical protein
MTRVFRAISDPTEDYLARCAQDKGLISCVRDLKLPGAGARYPAVALPRPLFTPRPEVTSLGLDVAELIDVLASLPDRCFGGSLNAYLAAQHNLPERTATMHRGSLGRFVKIGRIDSFCHGGEFKILEMNLGSVMGGLGVAKLNRGLMGDERFGRFAEAHGLGYEDPLEMMVTKIRGWAKSVVGTDDPVTALVEDSLGPSSQGIAVAEDLNKLGLKVVNGGLADVGQQRGKITIGTQPVDTVIRFFMLEDLLAANGETADWTEKIDMMVQAHHDGQTALFTGNDIDMHSSKASLGLLYEPGIWSSLSRPEQELVQRRVPWTRLVGQESSATATTARRALIEECVERREDLVLKPSNLALGTGISMGSDVAERRWRAMLTEPDRPDYVVQQRIYPDPEVIIDPDSGEPEEWDVNWGIYFSSDGYNGTWVRARRTKEKGIIGLNAETRPGCAFTY